MQKDRITVKMQEIGLLTEDCENRDTWKRIIRNSNPKLIDNWNEEKENFIQMCIQ